MEIKINNRKIDETFIKIDRRTNINEVKSAIKSISKGKREGPDEIKNELLKELIDIISE